LARGAEKRPQKLQRMREQEGGIKRWQRSWEPGPRVFISYSKEFAFYSKCNDKIFLDFRQGCDST
jgi:hypothetical protein